MNRGRTLYIAACILALLLLSGCTREARPVTFPTNEPTAAAPTAAPTEPEETFPPLAYSGSRPFLFPEVNSTSGGTRNVVRTELDGISYAFETRIPPEKRDEMVWEAHTILESLQARFGQMENPGTLLFRQGDCAPQLSGSTLALGEHTLGTPDYAIGMARMVLGNEVNYGLLYALGTEIAQERGYPVEEPLPLEDALTLCDKAPCYLDLNYACFLEDYAGESILPRVKSLARAFFSSLTEEEQNDLLTGYSDEKYCRYLSAFLEANGKPAYDNEDLRGTLFYNGGQYVRLAWETEEATFYVANDFREVFGGDCDDLLNAGYEALRGMVIENMREADFVQSKLGKYYITNKRPSVVYLAPESASIGGTATMSQINMFSTMPGIYLHEYAHSVVFDSYVNDGTAWRSEVISYYYCNVPDDPTLTQYFNAFIREPFMQSSLWGLQDTSYTALLQAAEAQLGRPLDWQNKEDILYLINACVAQDSYYDTPEVIQSTDGAPIGRVSFAAYLMGLVEEDAVLDALVYNTPEETFGRTWDELIADWTDYLNKEFAWANELA